MGNWQLEIAKMAIYIAFPVALFHYANQPEYFEEWIVKTRRQWYPPQDTPEILDLKAGIKRLKEKQEREMLAALEENK